LSFTSSQVREQTSIQYSGEDSFLWFVAGRACPFRMLRLFEKRPCALRQSAVLSNSSAPWPGQRQSVRSPYSRALHASL